MREREQPEFHEQEKRSAVKIVTLLEGPSYESLPGPLCSIDENV